MHANNSPANNIPQETSHKGGPSDSMSFNGKQEG